MSSLATIEENAYQAEFSIKHFRHVIGKHIEIRRYPDLAGHRPRGPRTGRAAIGNQSSNRLPRLGKDNLIALLYHFDESREFSLSLRDITHNHNRMVPDQIWSGQFFLRTCVYRMSYGFVYRSPYTHTMLQL